MCENLKQTNRMPILHNSVHDHLNVYYTFVYSSWTGKYYCLHNWKWIITHWPTGYGNM